MRLRVKKISIILLVLLFIPPVLLASGDMEQTKTLKKDREIWSAKSKVLNRYSKELSETGFDLTGIAVTESYYRQQGPVLQPVYFKYRQVGGIVCADYRSIVGPPVNKHQADFIRTFDHVVIGQYMSVSRDNNTASHVNQVFASGGVRSAPGPRADNTDNSRGYLLGYLHESLVDLVYCRA